MSTYQSIMTQLELACNERDLAAWLFDHPEFRMKRIQAQGGGAWSYVIYKVSKPAGKGNFAEIEEVLAHSWTSHFDVICTVMNMVPGAIPQRRRGI